MKVMVERILLWFGGAMAVLARYTAPASTRPISRMYQMSFEMKM